jgi:putative spermidine/putrescine transport system ATP-binding protein
MNVYNNLAFGLKIRKKKNSEIAEAVKRVLDFVRLPGIEKKFPHELSGGQQQRIAVARSLLLEPAVLLLDEPFSALDAKLRCEMREELRDIQARTGLTMIFVTHDQEEALSISDRIVVMNQGCIEQIGTPQEIYDNPQSLFVAQFIGKMNFIKGMADGQHIYAKELQLNNVYGLQGEITIAIRPEDIRFNTEDRGFSGVIRQVIILGHYAEVVLETVNGGMKAFVPRESVKELSPGQNVKLSFAKTHVYQSA